MPLLLAIMFCSFAIVLVLYSCRQCHPLTILFIAPPLFVFFSTLADCWVFLSSNPVSSKSDTMKDQNLDTIKPYFEEEPSCDSKPFISSKSTSFSFSCPSLLLNKCQQKNNSWIPWRENFKLDEGVHSVPLLKT